jgi:Tol biopolymer transport system component
MSQVEPRGPASRELSAPLVRAQLTRILSSELFSRSDRLSAFLRFIVEQTLNGQGERLKEQVIAGELYGKEPDFNTAADPIVRVDARRLRDKLREYYATAPHEAVVISVPKGSYTPVFEATENGMASIGTAVQPPAGTRSGRDHAAQLRWPGRWIVIAALVLLGVGMVGVSMVRNWRSDPAALRLFTVTSFPGWEGLPSISPDGNFVAFARSDPDLRIVNDLWVREVDGDALRRLTDTPDLSEVGPVWSPDGREIAFMALDGVTSRGVFVMSVLGGQKRKVTEGGAPTWMPDGRSLVVHDRLPNGTLGFFHHVIATGARRQLTSPSADFSDVYPAVSPDGTTLAFVRYSRRSPKQALFLLPMSGGEPVRRTDWAEPAGGFTWTPDGRELLYASADLSGARMYRLSAVGTDRGRLVREIPLTAGAPSASRARRDGTFRLAFVHGQADAGLRLLDLYAATGKDGADAATRFCDSARMDTPGRFSRDGAQVAFASNRSGSLQVWVAGRDGSSLRSVTAIQAASVNVGSWSPDGRAVAIDAVVNGNADIYLVGTEGGPPRRLTDSPSIDSDPEWSGDGRWIYYVSDTSGRSEIWRIPAGGGQAAKITSGGAFEPRESSDGRTLYYVDRARRAEGLGAVVSLKQVPAAGGEERVVFSGVRGGTWDITDRGIIFLTTDSELPAPGREGDALALYDFADHRVRRLATLPFTLARFKAPRLAVSRDGRWVLANHLDAWERDVMVADNFR